MTPEELKTLKSQTEQEILLFVAQSMAKFVKLSGGYQIKNVTVYTTSVTQIGGQPNNYAVKAEVEVDI